MNRILPPLLALVLCLLPACTNILYQGELTARDAYGKERNFILYWTRTDPLIGQSKAGPAILLTECSPLTRIDFSEQAEGIVFRGMPGYDRLAGQNGATDSNIICGKVANFARWTDAAEGALSVAILCEPVSDEFAQAPRNYLAARSEPYLFSVIEKVKKWSLLGETLAGPQPPECRSR
jgi:hypothetical protein